MKRLGWREERERMRGKGWGISTRKHGALTPFEIRRQCQSVVILQGLRFSSVLGMNVFLVAERMLDIQ